LRLFYALWPEDAVRSHLNALQSGLQGRVTRSANLHLTVAFLGDRESTLLPLLCGILDELPATPLELTLDCIGYFSQRKIVWAGTEHVPAGLTVLHAALNGALAAHGVNIDTPPAFRPHVTLARDAPQPAEQRIAPILWSADHVALVESVNEKDGVYYRVLASRRLGNR
jgi:2'-5' RNA ligase